MIRSVQSACTVHIRVGFRASHIRTCRASKLSRSFQEMYFICHKSPIKMYKVNVSLFLLLVAGEDEISKIESVCRILVVIGGNQLTMSRSNYLAMWALQLQKISPSAYAVRRMSSAPSLPFVYIYIYIRSTCSCHVSNAQESVHVEIEREKIEAELNFFHVTT